MESKDIRWKQRFQNFERSLQYLEQALKIQQPDIIQKAGLIQFFERSFELAWNVVKDYLEEQGFIEIKSPRSALKKVLKRV
ncbi:MAG: nucleotidyltransferase substrate binding protein [Segetibacter sp.]